MIAYLALLPCAVAAIAVLAFRRSVLTASLLALATAAGIWSLEVFSAATTGQLSRAAIDAIILELLVGFVIFAGILFVTTSNRGGGQDVLVQAIETLSLSPPRTVILVAVGIGVMMESLTGYGVSMFLTVPLLLKVVSRGRAICLALIGMSLMPWGALSITALLGAELAGLPPKVLAAAMLFTSGPVAMVMPLFCLAFVPGVAFKDILYALVAGLVLVSGIAICSYWIGVEIAGVGGGLALIAFSVLFSVSKRSFAKSLTSPEILPYGLLIAAVVVQKLVVPELAVVGVDLAIETDRVSFHVLSSPGIALLAIAILCLVWRPTKERLAQSRDVFRAVTARSWPALLSILAFLMTARLLVETGSIQALATTVSAFGLYPAAAFTAAMGAIGSYVTGSGTASTALFMSSAAATGISFDAAPLFASLQISAAAHAGVAALPIIAILLAALSNREVGDERTAVRMGLSLGAIWVLIVIASGSLQIAAVL